MIISKKLREKSNDYVGSFRKSEVERMSQVFDMVRNMKTSIEERGYNVPRVRVVRKARGNMVDLYIEDES
jgi:hypothetical protein